MGIVERILIGDACRANMKLSSKSIREKEALSSECHFSWSLLCLILSLVSMVLSSRPCTGCPQGQEYSGCPEGAATLRALWHAQFCGLLRRLGGSRHRLVQGLQRLCSQGVPCGCAFRQATQETACADQYNFAEARVRLLANTKDVAPGAARWTPQRSKSFPRLVDSNGNVAFPHHLQHAAEA